MNKKTYWEETNPETIKEKTNKLLIPLILFSTINTLHFINQQNWYLTTFNLLPLTLYTLITISYNKYQQSKGAKE